MTATQTKTPGYNRRLAIFFDLDRNGKRRAYYWSAMQMRSFPIGLAKADQFIAEDAADHLPCHPIKGPRG